MSEQRESELTGADYLKATLCAAVYDIAEVTPLEEMEKISERIDNQVFVKREDRQLVHSFKIRGAQAMIASLTDEERKRGVIAASAGNHAQGVALSASKLGISSLIVMPLTTADIKVEAVKSFGGDVLLYGANFDEAKAKAIELVKEQNRVFIPPFDHPLVIAGQGSIAMELLQQNPKLDRIFVPVGGGGLAAGVAAVIKQIMPSIKVIAVEPVDSACLKAALEAGKPVDLEHVGLFAEGVAVKRIGDETFRLCQQYIDDTITVDSDEICAAVKDLFDDVRAIAEPSGAVALAGLKKYVAMHNIHSEKLAHILSGANLNFHNLRYISERCELGEKREALLAVTIPEQKGSFLTFCKLLGGRSVTEFNYRYDENSPVQSASVFVGVRIHKADEKAALISELNSAGYQVVDLTDDEMAKLHVRYMIGGKPAKPLNEQIYSFQFPESQGALLKFLQTVGTNWNITMFHYRSHGTDYGRVLAAFEVDSGDKAFNQHLAKLGYAFHNESADPSLNIFLTNQKK
ncbi:threonine ammonia-lyase, biosynthetic [Orbaceae bacterium ESL0721]|nr:threonine ammonia-lyase, biosynthetic [Orbaceae bacterium ESL0721]